MPKETLYTRDQVEDALRKGGGVLVRSARILAKEYGRPITRQTLANYLERWPDLQDVLRQVKETLKDTAEDGLIEALEDRQSWAIQYYLKTQGKDRGYTEKLEVEANVDDKRPDLSGLSSDELRELQKLARERRQAVNGESRLV